MSSEKIKKDFFDKYFKELTTGLLANGSLKDFTTNSDIIGSFAEETVRNLPEYKISTEQIGNLQ